jgi:elongation factor P hydroxylase
MMSAPPHLNLPGWIDHLNRNVLVRYRTRLTGGFDEPLYRACCTDGWSEIRFTRDYERSALHELAHWCVAGPERRRQDDYGYWYAPDGRNNEQQQLFFRVEVRPQAIERIFCEALDMPFSVSVDNLGNHRLEGVAAFATAVEQCACSIREQGFPERAAAIHVCLRRWHADQGCLQLQQSP